MVLLPNDPSDLANALANVEFVTPSRSLTTEQKMPLSRIVDKGSALLRSCKKALDDGLLAPEEFGILFNALQHDSTGNPIVRAATFANSTEGNHLSQLRIVTISGVERVEDLENLSFEKEARAVKREAAIAGDGIFGSQLGEALIGHLYDSLIKGLPIRITEEAIIASAWITHSLDPQAANTLRRDPSIRRGGRAALIGICPEIYTVSLDIEPINPSVHRYSHYISGTGTAIRLEIPYSEFTHRHDFDLVRPEKGHTSQANIKWRIIEQNRTPHDVEVAEQLASASFEFMQRMLN